MDTGEKWQRGGGASGALRAARLRMLLVQLPIHMVAFALLYFGALYLLRSSQQRASWAATRTFILSIMEHTAAEADSESGPDLGSIGDRYPAVSLQFLDAQGRPLDAAREGSPSPPERAVRALDAGTDEVSWVEHRGGKATLRALLRVEGSRCARCHGESPRLASIALDLTSDWVDAEVGLRRNLIWLIVLWAALVSVTSAAVGRSARRAADRFHEELAAAVDDEANLAAPSPAPATLDPTVAELRDSLRRFLRRHEAQERKREQELASRLEHADQLASLGRLAAGLAHEIKNPLAGVQGALELVAGDCEDAESRELCEQSLAELERVNETLGLLLSAARPSPARPVATDPSDLLDRIESLLVPTLRKRDVELEIEVAAGSGPVPLDPAKIRQVLVNLVENAAEAMESGGRIEIRAGRLPAEDMFLITVRDDGPGIAKEDVDEIFRPFFTTKFGGTGLGLAIARTLVEQHGGRLEVESALGHGTIFLILLPTSAQETGEPPDA